MALDPCKGELPWAAGTIPIGIPGNWAERAFTSDGII
jgi:hypothetical protein